MESSQTLVNEEDITTEIDEKYKRTAVGCVIGYLRDHGHAPIEAIVKYVGTKRDCLLTANGKNFTKSAFGIVDYALSWYPKIFKLDDSFHYYLNKEEASKHEHDFKNKKEKRRMCCMLYKERCRKSREDRLKRAQTMRRIKVKIESELQGSSENYSPLTKAYLILISDNKEAISDLTKQVRQAYIELIRPKS